MKRAALLFVPVIVGACSTPSGGDRSSSAGDAAAIAQRATSFGVSGSPRSGSLHRPSAAIAALGPGLATSYEHTGGWIHPSFAGAARATHPAKLALGDGIDAGFRLVDDESGVDIAVAPLDAADAHAEVVDGYVVYASQGVSTLHRPMPTGTEDFVLFEAAPAAPELAYSLTLGDGARSLRLVAGTLEVLDAAGVPRLRAARPFVVGADGVRRPADLAVEGCAVDTDPRPPWGRAHPAPGARTCTVRVRWPDVAYPALVDPAWTTTGTLANPRWVPSAALLPSGHVLIVGSPDDFMCNPMAAELYDPASSTWAATGSPPSPACFLALTALDSGKVLATGDYARQYDETTGMWSAAGTLAKPRELHTSTLLTTGEVLVTGGQGGSDPNFIYFKSAELFNPLTTSWHAAASMANPHLQHTATRLADGRVLVAGGTDGDQPGTAVAEVYDPVADAWTTVAPMASKRAAHTATLLPSGAVLLVGGFGNVEEPQATAEIFDPVAGTFSPAGALALRRDYHSASLLPTGEVLIAGGGTDYEETPTAKVEIWSPSAGFRPSLSLGVARYLHTATNLASGAVLVACGDGASGFTDPLVSAEVTTNLTLALGAPCAAGVDCTTGFCSNGVCCESACAAPCDVCSMALGAPADGTCAIAAAGSVGAPTCAPYVCDGTSTACGTTCASSSDCAPSAHCDTASSTCIETGFDGVSCSTGEDCLTGFCADGVCCDTPCDNTCESCTAAGKGQGADGTCDLAAVGTNPNGGCTGPIDCHGTFILTPGCDQTGQCQAGVPVDCAGYTCDASGCLTQCTTTGDCAPMFACVAGACVHQSTTGSVASSTSGSGATSGPGPTGVGGAGGAGAGGGGTGGSSSGGCGCRLADETPRSPWLLAFALALAVRRRRAS